MNFFDEIAPETPVLWDVDCHGQPVRVPITLPAVWREDYQTEADNARDEQAEVVLGLLRFIVGEHPDIARAGGRAHLLAFMAGASRFKTQRALAEKLNLSDARISQIRKEIQAILPSLGKCNRRQTETPRH